MFRSGRQVTRWWCGWWLPFTMSDCRKSQATGSSVAAVAAAAGRLAAVRRLLVSLPDGVESTFGERQTATRRQAWRVLTLC
jgi:hypothetical protein